MKLKNHCAGPIASLACADEVYDIQQGIYEGRVTTGGRQRFGKY